MHSELTEQVRLQVCTTHRRIVFKARFIARTCIQAKYHTHTFWAFLEGGRRKKAMLRHTTIKAFKAWLACIIPDSLDREKEVDFLLITTVVYKAAVGIHEIFREV